MQYNNSANPLFVHGTLHEKKNYLTKKGEGKN